MLKLLKATMDKDEAGILGFYWLPFSCLIYVDFSHIYIIQALDTPQ